MRPVSSLSPQELRAALRGPGLCLRTGAFVTRVRSAIPQLADGIGQLYADYPSCAGGAYADFNIHLKPGAGLRRWLRPQVEFDLDGRTPFQPLPLAQAFPMFEWVLNWSISSQANHYLIVHAAVVERGGRAAILPAPPGSGKSTLCAALVHAGWRLLSDELALVRLADGLLQPVPRPVSLKNASIGVIRRFAPQAVFSPEVHDTSKGTIAHMKAPAAAVARAHEPARPAWLIFPRYQAGAAAQLAPLAPARAFMQLAENCFNYSVLGAAGFHALGALVDRVAARQFSYGDLDEAVRLFACLADAP